MSVVEHLCGYDIGIDIKKTLSVIPKNRIDLLNITKTFTGYLAWLDGIYYMELHEFQQMYTLNPEMGILLHNEQCVFVTDDKVIDYTTLIDHLKTVEEQIKLSSLSLFFRKYKLIDTCFSGTSTNEMKIATFIENMFGSKPIVNVSIKDMLSLAYEIELILLVDDTLKLKLKTFDIQNYFTVDLLFIENHRFMITEDFDTYINSKFRKQFE